MNASVYRFYLDVHKPHSGVCLDVKRGDANSRLLLITLSERGVPYRISPDCYAVFTAVKPDGNIVFNHCTIEGNQISYVLTPQTVAVDGRLNCEIKLYGADDTLITSSCFDIIVRPTVYNEGDEIESEQEVDALTHLISEATTVITAGKATNEESKVLLALLEAQKEELHQMVEDASNAEDSAKESAETALKSSQEAKEAAESALKASEDAKEAAEAAINNGSAVYVLQLSPDEADAQANTDAVTEAIAKHSRVILTGGDYPVKPGIVIESGKLDMNGAHLYSVDYKSSTPLVYLKGEAPEICNGELEGSYDLADTDEGYAFFEGESLICPKGVNDAYIHHMDLHNNWGCCIIPSENVERVYVETATKQGSNDFRFLSSAFEIPEGFKYVTAAGGVGYNYIISVSPVKYRFYDEGGKEIATVAGIPRERRVIPNGAKTVTFETTLDSETFVTYYAWFTNYTEALTVTDCKFHNFHSLGMANMPGPTTVARCSFVDAGRPRSDALFTTRATTGGIDIEDVQTPMFVMSDCYSQDCLKLLMFGGYKGTITNCIGDGIGVYRGWQCDITNCNVSQLYTMGGHCRISLNGVHADSIGIEPENAKDIRGNISTNSIPVSKASDVFRSFDNFVVKMEQHSTPHGKLSGRLNGTVSSISSSGIRWNGFSSEKGSHVVIDSTILPKANGNYYGTLSVDGETYGLESSVAFVPKGNTIHDSTFNIDFSTASYSAKDGDYDGVFDGCVFNLTGAAYFRRFTGTLTKPITLTFKNCTINNSTYHLFNFVPNAGGVVTFENCTIADEGKLFNGDASKMTINIITTVAVQTVNGIAPDENGNVEIDGLNDAAKTLLITILRNGVYSTDQSENITALAAKFGVTEPDVPDIPDVPDVPVVTKYTITNELVNVKSSNSTSSVNEGASYMATLTADEGYEISNVTVFVGGVDVTADVYADGVISIPAVTGNVEITASASMAETEAVLPDDGLIGYWDLRNAHDGGENNPWYPNIGDDSTIRLRPTYAPTCDSYGALLDNGTYGGATVQKLGSDGTWAGMNYGTEFTIVTMCYGGFVAPEKYYGLDGFKAFYPNPTYVKTDGTTASGTRIANNANKLGTDEYATVIVRVNENLLDILYNGEVAQSADGSTYDGFDYWVNSGLTIRSIKGQASGKLTALAVYDKALTDEEIVEALAYLKTLEVA